MDIGNNGRRKVPFVDLQAQYATIAGDVERAMAEVFTRGDFILGRDVQAFEAEFAAYCDTAHAIGIDSGTSALELALRAYDIGPGDEVITAANTFIATALAIVAVGATPVLVDVDPVTYTMDLDRLTDAVTPRTKAVIPVHLYGQPADMDPIVDLARQRGFVVIEDACQAHGARYKGRRAGSLGDAAAFSFYPGKNLGAYGDGGAIVTSDLRIADKVRLLRNYGQREKYHHVEHGFNRRLDTLQAAVLRVKLGHLDAWNGARRAHAAAYREALAGSSVACPSEASYTESVWHLYVIRVRDRAALQAHLSSLAIDSGIHYPVPIHLQPAYRGLGLRAGAFPVTERLAGQILSLPMYAELPADAVSRIATAVRASALEPPSEVGAAPVSAGRAHAHA